MAMDSEVTCCVYERASDHWYELQLPPWVETADVHRRRYNWEVPRVALAGNNVVFMEVGHRDRLTPVTGSWTFLPELPRGLEFSHVVGVLEDAKARCFKLVALDVMHNNTTATVYVYDSALGSWSAATSDLPDKAGAPGPAWYLFPEREMSRSGAFVGSVLYYLVGGKGNLLAYDLERAKWSWLEVKSPAPYAKFNGKLLKVCECSLINLRERLLCVTSFMEKDKSLEIWELDLVRMTWTLVGTMPSPMFTQFRGLPYNFISPGVVAGPDSEVYILNYKNIVLEQIVAVDLRPRPVACNWRWLPSCPYD